MLEDPVSFGQVVETDAILLWCLFRRGVGDDGNRPVVRVKGDERGLGSLKACRGAGCGGGRASAWTLGLGAFVMVRGVADTVSRAKAGEARTEFLGVILVFDSTRLERVRLALRERVVGCRRSIRASGCQCFDANLLSVKERAVCCGVPPRGRGCFEGMRRRPGCCLGAMAAVALRGERGDSNLSRPSGPRPVSRCERGCWALGVLAAL